jgi:protein-disulfide isomerase
MSKIYPFCLLTLILFIESCKFPENKQKQQERVATINNESIENKLLDSITAVNVYQIKKKALNTLISGRIIEIEAKNKLMSTDEYVNQEIYARVPSVSEKEINDYLSNISNGKVYTVDPNQREKAYNFLLYSKRKRRQREITDSLIEKKYKVDIFLKAPYTKVTLKGLKTYSVGDLNSKLQIVIITDFDCEACQGKFEAIDKLYDKFKSSVKFNFVTCSDGVTAMQIACEAASIQGKFKHMYDEIFKNRNNLSSELSYNVLAKKIGLNLKQFKNDMDNPTIKDRIRQNNDIIKSNPSISIPAFIIDDKFIPAELNINEVEREITDFLKFLN